MSERAGNEPAAAPRRPGPRRPAGAPVGPDEVRAAVIEAAGLLFVRYGVDRVSLRDIAAAADVQLGLIARYVGSRDELDEAVFVDFTSKVARELVDKPLEQVSFERESVVGQWVALLTHFAMLSRPLPPSTAQFNPVSALAEVFEHEYGADRVAARLRAAQVLASALGWRIFENFLLDWGGLRGIGRTRLHAELNSLHRRVGATPYPSPPDPRRRRHR